MFQQGGVAEKFLDGRNADPLFMDHVSYGKPSQSTESALLSVGSRTDCGGERSCEDAVPVSTYPQCSLFFACHDECRTLFLKNSRKVVFLK